jgi:PTS system fructose-specific IIC component
MEAQDLIKYFHEDLFIPLLQAKTKEEALLEMVTRFEAGNFIKRKEILLEMLKQREGLGSTGIGKGIAIPHGRTTVAKDVIIAFANSDAGLAYDSVDNQPVHLIFMVIAPPIEAGNKYLPVLGKLVEVLNNDGVRTKLKKIETFEELLKCFQEG